MSTLQTAADLVERPGFQPPRHIDQLYECFFYHSMELPGVGLQTGSWDLRSDLDSYLGKQDYAGKRVVDVGTASGYLAFEMEKRGAEVVAVDRLLRVPLDEMGLIPFSDFETRFGTSFEQSIEARAEFHLKLQNSFWFSHRVFNSKIKLYCGTAYNCPPELGQFDYAFFGSILLHLRDPLQALTSFARVTREKLIITETLEPVGGVAEAPVLFLRPNINDKTNPGTWWYLTPTLLMRFLEILGFRKIEIFYHKALWVPDSRPTDHFTIVGTRVPDDQAEVTQAEPPAAQPKPGLAQPRRWFRRKREPDGAPADPNLLGALDSPKDGAVISGKFVVGGWAVAKDSPIRKILIELDGQPLTETTLGIPRPDVAQNFPNEPSAPSSGWNTMIDANNLTAGKHSLVIQVKLDNGTTKQLAEVAITARK